MTMHVEINKDMPTTSHERMIIATVVAYITMGREADAWRVLFNQTGRALQRRRVIITSIPPGVDDDLDGEFDD